MQNIMIKIGDRVKFISDTYVGKVIKINGQMAEVAVEDGFDVPVMLNDLVVVDHEQEMEAIRRIGVSDERPGTNKGSKQKEIKKTPVKREAAYARYGKVALVDDYEDDEEIIDISHIRAQYAKNFAAINSKELERDAKEREISGGWIEAPVEEVVVEDNKKTEEVEKLRSVSLESLDKELKIKLENEIKPPVQPKKKPENEIEVIDLHAHEILDSTAGMSSGEILKAQLSRFNIALSLAVKSGKHGKIVFIHGVGSGKLKYELQRELSRSYPKLQSQDASFKEYGYGAIMIFF